MKIVFRGVNIIFVDVEASGLASDSFPVEIGWSIDDDQLPQSLLLRPDKAWSKTDAYADGFAVHGISYADLITKGIPLTKAAKNLNTAWHDAVLVSDAQAHDERWIGQIYDALGHQSPWRLVEFDVVFSTLYQQGGLAPAAAAEIAAAAKRLPAPHRAGADAHRLRRIARAAIDPDRRAQLLAL